MCGHRAQNLLILRSPQLSLSPDLDVRAGMDLYVRHGGYYLSQNIGPAIAGSAGPAPAPLTVPSVRYTLESEHRFMHLKWYIP